MLLPQLSLISNQKANQFHFIKESKIKLELTKQINQLIESNLKVKAIYRVQFKVFI